MITGYPLVLLKVVSPGLAFSTFPLPTDPICSVFHYFYAGSRRQGRQSESVAIFSSIFVLLSHYLSLFAFARLHLHLATSSSAAAAAVSAASSCLDKMPNTGRFLIRILLFFFFYPQLDLISIIDSKQCAQWEQEGRGRDPRTLLQKEFK